MHLAEAAEIDLALALGQVAPGLLHGEQAEHRPLQLQSFAGSEILPGGMVVQQHQPPGPGHVVAAGQRAQTPLHARLHGFAGGVDPGEQQVLPRQPALLLGSLHRTQRDLVAAGPDQLHLRVAPQQVAGLQVCLVAPPVGRNALAQLHLGKFAERPLQALKAADRGIA